MTARTTCVVCLAVMAHAACMQIVVDWLSSYLQRLHLHYGLAPPGTPPPPPSDVSYFKQGGASTTMELAQAQA